MSLPSAELSAALRPADLKKARGKRLMSDELVTDTAARGPADSASGWNSELEGTSSESAALAATTARARRVRRSSGNNAPLAHARQRAVISAGANWHTGPCIIRRCACIDTWPRSPPYCASLPAL